MADIISPYNWEIPVEYKDNWYSDFKSLIQSVADTVNGPWVDTRAYTTFALALTAAANKTLIISDTQTLVAHTTIPSTVSVMFLQSGKIALGNFNLAFDGHLVGNLLHKIFDYTGSGVVTFGTGSVSKIYSVWFGDTGDGTTDDSSAINQAISSIPTASVYTALGEGTNIIVLPGIHLIGSGIINNGRKISLLGSSVDNTTLKKNFDGDLIKFDLAFRIQSIENMTLDGNSKTGTLIYLNSCTRWTLKNMRLQNNGGVATTDTDAALYAASATIGHMDNVQLVDNIRNGYFYEINALTAIKLGVYGGSVYDDMEFIGASDTEIYNLSVEQQNGKNGGFAFKYCVNVKIEGAYIEHDHSVNVFTIGDTNPTRGFSLKGVNLTRCGTIASSKATILAQDSSMNLAFENIHISMTAATGAHTGGWIELAEVRNVSIKNLSAQGMNTVVSAADMIKYSGAGKAVNLLLENIFEYENSGSVESMSVNADVVTIKNTNVPLTVNTGSTQVICENCTGGITDNAGTTTIKSGHEKTQIKSANYTMTATDSGLTTYINTDAVVITLPATVVGYVYTFVNVGAAGAVGFNISPAAVDKIIGGGLSGSDDEDIINTKATAKTGDRIKIIGDGVNGWFVQEMYGTWAEATP